MSDSESDSSTEETKPKQPLSKAEKKAAKKAKKAKKADKKAKKEAKKLAKKVKKAAKANKKSKKKDEKDDESTKEEASGAETDTKDENTTTSVMCKDETNSNTNTNTSDNETENKKENDAESESDGDEDNDSESTKRKLETTEEDSDEPPLKKRKLLTKKDEMTEDTKEDESSTPLNDNQMEGTVLRWNNAKGFGFIGYHDKQLGKEEEIFVHCNDVYLGDYDKGDKSMAINQKVVFEMADDAKISGKKSAVNVTGPNGAACKHEEYVNGDTKLSGIVIRWNDEKGFGFVRADDKQYEESFAHWNAVKGSKGFDTTWLEVNEKIDFDLMADPKKPGSFKAINITGGNGGDLKCGIRGPGVRTNGGGNSGGGGGSFDAFFDKKKNNNDNSSSSNKKSEEEEGEKKEVTFTEGKSIGTVLSWNNDKGFGFIKPKKQGEEDVFVHASDVYCERDATSLNVGETVEFLVGEDNGRVRAQEVTGPGGRPCEGIQYLNKDGKIKGRCVKWHDDKGFGFITPSEGNFSEDAFAHFRNIKGQRGFDTSWLSAGEEVEFDLKINPKNGKTEATNITAGGGYGAKLECQKNSY